MMFWVFGYGSLVWNPGFEFDEKVIGFLKGYRRAFDLACIDHRGTPDHPSRTRTLEENDGSIGWGAAYCVRGGPKKEKAIMAIHIDSRQDKEQVVFRTSSIGAHGYSNSNSIWPLWKQRGSFLPLGVRPCSISGYEYERVMKFELANEVRKILGGLQKEKLIGGLPEPIAIALDS